MYLGDIYHPRYKVIHKLGFGAYSTVWLARDLQATVQTRVTAVANYFITICHSESQPLIPPCRVADTSPSSSSWLNVLAGTMRSRFIATLRRVRGLTLLDHFKVRGPNGEHDVLVLQVIGPHLGTMFNDDPAVVQRAIRSLAHQIMLGTSFLHDCGIVHGGSVNSSASRSTAHRWNLDLHKGNIAVEISDFDGISEERAIMTLGPQECVPVITRDHRRQTDSIPKYLVLPGSLVECAKQDDLSIKIIDLGEGLLRRSQPCRQTLKSSSLLQDRGA